MVDEAVLKTKFDKMRLGFSYRMDKSTRIAVEMMLESIEGHEGDELYKILQTQVKKVDSLWTFNPNTILRLRSVVRDPESRRLIASEDLSHDNGITTLKWEGQVKAIVKGGREYYLVDEKKWNDFLSYDSVEEIFETIDEATLTSNNQHYVNMESILLISHMFHIEDLMFYVQ